MVRLISARGWSLPVSIMASIEAQRGTCLPWEPTTVSSLPTIRSMGRAIRPRSALLVRPICRWRPRAGCE
jgi:hypothetical protein